MLKRILFFLMLTVFCFAQHGGNPILIVEEIDGTPSVAGVWKIKVTNSSLTDEGNGIVRINYTAGAADNLNWNADTDNLAWNAGTDDLKWGG